jgi:hypothetical protein
MSQSGAVRIQAASAPSTAAALEMSQCSSANSWLAIRRYRPGAA